MSRGPGAALLAVGFILSVATLLWNDIDAAQPGANIGAGLLGLLGMSTSIVGLILFAVAGSINRRRT